MNVPPVAGLSMIAIIGVRELWLDEARNFYMEVVFADHNPTFGVRAAASPSAFWPPYSGLKLIGKLKG